MQWYPQWPIEKGFDQMESFGIDHKSQNEHTLCVWWVSICLSYFSVAYNTNLEIFEKKQVGRMDGRYIDGVRCSSPFICRLGRTRDVPSSSLCFLSHYENMWQTTNIYRKQYLNLSNIFSFRSSAKNNSLWESTVCMTSIFNWKLPFRYKVSHQYWKKHGNTSFMMAFIHYADFAHGHPLSNKLTTQ